MPQLILASQSASRKQLLTEAGYTFKVIPSDIKEVIDTSLPIPDAIEKLSTEKAKAVASQADIPPDAVIVAADSVVVFEGEIIGKPKDKDDLIRTLTRMSGREHGFVTGYTIINMEGRKMFSGSVASSVQLKKLSPEFLQNYGNGNHPYTKAGGYGIREDADRFVQGYKGDYTNIVGLPLKKVEPILKKLGVQKS